MFQENFNGLWKSMILVDTVYLKSERDWKIKCLIKNNNVFLFSPVWSYLET